MLELLKSDHSWSEKGQSALSDSRSSAILTLIPKHWRPSIGAGVAEMEPWLNRLIGTSEAQRVILLSRAGVELNGEPNESWLSRLSAAASGPAGPAVPGFALMEIIVGEKRCCKFGGWEQRQRALGLKAYLLDAGKRLP